MELFMRIQKWEVGHIGFKSLPMAFAMALLPRLALGATVRGKTTLSHGQDAAHAVIYLEGGTRPKPMGHVVIDQRNRTFIPHVTAITIGTTVDFPNNDTIFHNVFAEYSKEDRFDIGMYPRGSTRKHTFAKSGIVALMCSVHPDMSAYIAVLDTPFFAVADAQGRYAIKGVQPGRYTLRVWHESGETDSEVLQVEGDREANLKTHR